MPNAEDVTPDQISLACLRDEHRECVRRLTAAAGDPSRRDIATLCERRIEQLNAAIMELARHGVA